MRLLACRRFGCCCFSQFLFAFAFIPLQICTSEKKQNEGEEEEEEKEEEAPGESQQQQHQRKQKAYRQERRSQAASAFVDGLIHCRFEETDAQGDEVVKMRIIELLAKALEDPGVGPLLEDESVWEVVQTCFVNRNEVAHSRQLCHAAEQVERD